MYEVKVYKGNYGDRQRQANEDQCAGYVEHHFNSSENEAAGYSLVVVGSNASQTSKNWGRWYARAIGNEFGIRVGGNDGILVGGWNGRGDYNLRFTNMPAVLLEPLFASNPLHAEWIRSEPGQDRLARVLAESIQRFFPGGGLIGFSVGHKYKTSNPHDRGAAVAGGGSEADFAEVVLQKTEALLTADIPEVTSRTLRITKNGALLNEYELDEDADVRWDAERSLLSITESGG